VGRHQHVKGHQKNLEWQPNLCVANSNLSHRYRDDPSLAPPTRIVSIAGCVIWPFSPSISSRRLPIGEDEGNHFVTLRVGFGLGAGISYTPYASIPGPDLQNRYQHGFVLSASGQAKFAAGPLSTKLEYGAARNYAEGVSDFFGGPNFSFRNRTLALGASGSVAGQATYYTKRTSYFADQGTCHL